MQNQLLENLFAYKKTSALLAAFQLGLFQQIKEHGCFNQKICSRLEWNERYFFVRTALPPVEGIFYNGQIFDAYNSLPIW